MTWQYKLIPHLYLLNAVLNSYHFGHIVKRVYILVLFFLYNYHSDLVLRAERTAFCVEDFISLSLSSRQTKTANLADCQLDASEVAQICVIPFYSRVYMSR